MSVRELSRWAIDCVRALKLARPRDISLAPSICAIKLALGHEPLLWTEGLDQKLQQRLKD